MACEKPGRRSRPRTARITNCLRRFSAGRRPSKQAITSRKRAGRGSPPGPVGSCIWDKAATDFPALFHGSRQVREFPPKSAMISKAEKAIGGPGGTRRIIGFQWLAGLVRENRSCGIAMFFGTFPAPGNQKRPARARRAGKVRAADKTRPGQGSGIRAIRRGRYREYVARLAKPAILQKRKDDRPACFYSICPGRRAKLGGVCPPIKVKVGGQCRVRVVRRAADRAISPDKKPSHRQKAMGAKRINVRGSGSRWKLISPGAFVSGRFSR